MDSPTYIKQALRTESTPPALNINQVQFHALLEGAVQLGFVLDAVKRQIFYGKTIDRAALLPHLAAAVNVLSYVGQHAQEPDEGLDINVCLDEKTMAEVAQELPPQIAGMALSNINIRALHAALGCVTESIELLDSIKKQYETGQFDAVNFGEEIGDIEWYQAIGFDETGVTEASCREKNIAKLRKRYPDKFDSYAATNRDLAGERTILEGGQRVLPGSGEVKPVAGTQEQ